MGDLSGWMNLLWGDLFAAWLMAAIFWAIAGMAAASWARTSRTLGGVIGASTLFLGTFGIVIFGIAKRQRVTGGPASDHRYDVDASGTPNVSGHDTSGFAGGSGGPTGFDSTGFDSTGFGSTGFGQSGYGTTGFASTGSGSKGFGVPGFGQPGFGQPGFGDPGFGQPGFGETGFGEPGFPASGSALGTGRPDRGTDHRSSTPAIVWLSIVVAAIAGFIAALFAPWLTLGLGVEVDGTEVALVPLLCTILPPEGHALLNTGCLRPLFLNRLLQRGEDNGRIRLRIRSDDIDARKVDVRFFAGHRQIQRLGRHAIVDGRIAVDRQLDLPNCRGRCLDGGG